MPQLLAGAPQAVLQAADGSGGGDGGLEGGAVFERWIKTGAWAEEGDDPAARALSIARAVVKATCVLCFVTNL